MQTIKADTSITRTQAEVIVKLARNNINAAATAREMFMHRNTVDYHIRMIYRNTGKNPLSFYDLLDLLPMAQRTLGEAS
jgi:DNA-binding PucR family transcriptional regulator